MMEGTTPLSDFARMVADELRATNGLYRITLAEFGDIATEPLRRRILTNRETEVLRLVSLGYGNKQVATALGISEQTIKNHMTSIMVKLEARDRTHAVAIAICNRWIPADVFEGSCDEDPRQRRKMVK
ncbi:MAG: response regulator transcription factor [Dehalococcoidia bacterium]|nr:response regulator transcription factor [Dehalococcoidia bacterium]